MEVQADNHHSSLLQVALEKSKSAVKGDSGLNDEASLQLYNEAVDALQQVIEDGSDIKTDKPRLKSIQDTYLKRIEFLSSLYLNTKSVNKQNKKKSVIRTPSLMSILPTAPVNTKSAIVAPPPQSALLKNKRLSNYTTSCPAEEQEIQHLPQSRKSSFFNIKPSRSTPTMEKQKRKKDANVPIKKNLLNRYSSDFSKLGNILSLRNSTAAVGITSAEVIPPCPSFKVTDKTSTLTEDCDGNSEIAIEQDAGLPLEEHSSQHSASSSVTGPIHQKVPNLSLSNSESTMNDTDTLPTVPSSWEPDSITDTVDEHTSNDAQEIISPIISHPTEMIHTMEKSFSTSSFQSLLRRKKTAKKDSAPNTYHQDSTSSTSSFASYLDTTTKHNRSTTAALNRSKSKKKWSLQLPSKMSHLSLNSCVDPVAFMAEPILRTSSESEVRDTNCTLTLMDRLLQSMLQGGCVTSKLHIPMDLWYQPNVRLPATDAKIAACELIMVAMDRMEKRKNFSDCTGVETDLKVLEQTLLQIKHTLVKRLGFDIADDTPSKMQSSSRYSSSIGSLIGGNTGIRTSQVFSSWSSKLIKSVERMKLEASKAIPGSDQNDEYVQTLIRLFTQTRVLETWNTKLSTKIESSKNSAAYERCQNLNERCIQSFKVTVCQFVLKDYETLLDKWLKKSMEWIME